jgi:hypothetical protein
VPRWWSTTSAASPTAPGADLTPAQQVAAEIAGMGGDAIVNGDDVSDFNGAKRMIDQASTRSARSTS